MKKYCKIVDKIIDDFIIINNLPFPLYTELLKEKLHNTVKADQSHTRSLSQND